MANASAAPTYASNKGSVPAEPGTEIAEARGTALEFLRLLAQELSKGTVDLPCFPDVVIDVEV